MKTVLFLVVGLIVNVTAHAEVGKMKNAEIKCQNLAAQLNALKNGNGGQPQPQPQPEDATNGSTTDVN